MPDGFSSGLVLHHGGLVQYVGQVFEEVYAVQSAGAGQGIEDAAASGSGMTTEEHEVLS